MKASGSWRLFAVAALCLWLPPAPAQATLTARVEGFEDAVNAAWAGTPDCTPLLVHDLLGTGDDLTLTATGLAAFTLTRRETADAACTSAGWHVKLAGVADARSPACARSLCALLDGHPTFAPALEAALRASHDDHELPGPARRWSPPALGLMGFTWFALCIATIVLIAGLWLVARRAAKNAGDAGPDRRDWMLLGGLALAGVLLRGWLAAHSGFWDDEKMSWGYDSVWRNFDGREIIANPPMYLVLAFPVLVLSNGDPHLCRFVPVLLGAALVLAVGRLGYMLGGRRVAGVAAFLAAFNPGLVLATTYFRTYSALAPMTALALLFTISAARSGRTVERYLAATCIAGMLLSHYFGVFVALGLAIWLLIVDRQRWREWVGPVALFLTLFLPFAAGMPLAAHDSTQGGLAGPLHAQRLVLTTPSSVGGLLWPSLTQPMFQDDRIPWFQFGAVLIPAVFLLGAWRLPARERLGIALPALLSWAIPLYLSLHVRTIRDFQFIGVAVPGTVLIAALTRPRAPRPAWALFAVFAVAFVGLFFERIPHDIVNDRHYEALADEVRAASRQGPVYVWPEFAEIASSVGVNQEEADLMNESRSMTARALRSCSTAAVREAAAAAGSDTVQVVVTHHAECDAHALSGRGVVCPPLRALPRPAIASITTCRVDRGAPAWQGPDLQNLHARLHVIERGHRGAFETAALPARLGQVDSHGVTLVDLRDTPVDVSYQLSHPGDPPVWVTARPHIVGDAVDGTEVTTDRPLTQIQPDLRPSTEALVKSLQGAFPASSWIAFFTMAGTGLYTEEGRRGDQVDVPPWGLFSAAVCLVIVFLDVFPRRRRASSDSRAAPTPA